MKCIYAASKYAGGQLEYMMLIVSAGQTSFTTLSRPGKSELPLISADVSCSKFGKWQKCCTQVGGVATGQKLRQRTLS